MFRVRRRETSSSVQFAVNFGGGGSMCVKVATKCEAEDIPSKNRRQEEEAPVLREVVFETVC